MDPSDPLEIAAIAVIIALVLWACVCAVLSYVIGDVTAGIVFVAGIARVVWLMKYR